MKVKRYVVDTLPDALNKIRQELGKDAVILNTKQVRVGGILGLFSKKKIEVIAVADEQAPVPEKRPSQAAVSTAVRELAVPAVGSVAAAEAYRRATPNMSVAASGSAKTEAKSMIASPMTTAGLTASAFASAASPSSGTAAASASEMTETASRSSLSPTYASAPAQTSENSSSSVDVMEQFKRAAAQTIQKAAARQVEVADTQPDVLSHQQLLAEIKEMKDLVVKLTMGGSPNVSAPATHHAFSAIEARLIKQGVAPNVVSDIVERSLAESGMSSVSSLNEAQALALVRRQLLKLFEDNPPSGIREGSRIVQFIGPTGVGKTTTIAKLAAEQVLKYNKQIGFVTSDTYRIAAIDQLKTYGAILNVPVEVVFSPEELREALAKLSDRELIFMDTAGRNYRDEASIQYLQHLLSEQGQSETYLVLSLVSKYEDLKAIIDNMGHVRVNKVLWTKMDETASYGSIINVLHEYALPASYVTHGQNVPDDISLLHPEWIIQHILGEDAYG